MSITVEVVVATSMDGRISTPDRRPWRWSDPEDHAWLLKRMAEADLLVVGAATIRAENPSVTVPPDWANQRVADGRTPQPARLVLSPSLSIAPDCRAAKRSDATLLVAARADAIAERGAGFEGKATLLPFDREMQLRPILERAAEIAGGGRIVCLGGGRTNALFLEQDLVDHVSLTISSFVIGAEDAPGPFDGHGFAPGQFPRFDLVDMRRAGRDVLLQYDRVRGGNGSGPADKESNPRGLL
jgi:2,5-diamino-6-(ribosylamino)-4(3H)-pyrimidinone 5'-phosphate reductase